MRRPPLHELHNNSCGSFAVGPPSARRARRRACHALALLFAKPAGVWLTRGMLRRRLTRRRVNPDAACQRQERLAAPSSALLLTFAACAFGSRRRLSPPPSPRHTRRLGRSTPPGRMVPNDGQYSTRPRFQAGQGGSASADGGGLHPILTWCALTPFSAAPRCPNARGRAVPARARRLLAVFAVLSIVVVLAKQLEKHGDGAPPPPPPLTPLARARCVRRARLCGPAAARRFACCADAARLRPPTPRPRRPGLWRRAGGAHVRAEAEEGLPRGLAPLRSRAPRSPQGALRLRPRLEEVATQPQTLRLEDLRDLRRGSRRDARATSTTAYVPRPHPALHTYRTRHSSTTAQQHNKHRRRLVHPTHCCSSSSWNSSVASKPAAFTASTHAGSIASAPSCARRRRPSRVAQRRCGAAV